MSNKLIYFGDPLCSWCYGFAPEISEVKNHYQERFGFELVMGGLRPYGKELMSELKGFLKHHWEEVNTRSGQPFQYKILESTDFVYDTEPPSRAVIAVKEIDPELEFEFYKEVQKGFYYDNLNTNLVESYDNILEGFNISQQDFGEKFNSEDIKEKTRQSFAYSQQLGVRGFPTTVLQHGEKLYLVANGYTEAKVLIERIEKLMADEQKENS